MSCVGLDNGERRQKGLCRFRGIPFRGIVRYYVHHRAREGAGEEERRRPGRRATRYAHKHFRLNLGLGLVTGREREHMHFVFLCLSQLV